jgi:hypothetical protein
VNTDALTDLLEALGEPPHIIDPDDIRRAGQTRRRGRRMVAVAVVALVAVAVGAPYLALRRDNGLQLTPEQTSAAPTTSPSPTDSADHLATASPWVGPSSTGLPTPTAGACRQAPSSPSPLPRYVTVTSVVECVMVLTRRPGQGIWLRYTEQRTESGARAYGEALKAPVGGLQCARNNPPITETGYMDLVADASGRLYRASMPSRCSRDPFAGDAAAHKFAWHTVASEWVMPMISEANANGPCVTAFMHSSIFAGPSRGDLAIPQVGMSSEGQGGRNLMCTVLSDATDVGPQNLIEARRLGEPAATQAEARLSRTPGRVNRLLSPAANPGTPPATCTTPATTAWEFTIDGHPYGYADFGPCIRAVGPTFGPASSDFTSLAYRAASFVAESS